MYVRVFFFQFIKIVPSLLIVATSLVLPKKVGMAITFFPQVFIEFLIYSLHKIFEGLRVYGNIDFMNIFMSFFVLKIL